MAKHLAEEPRLVAAAQEGDADAFEVLVNQYHRNIYAMVIKITGNPEDTEDVLQDGLLKAYCALKHFRGNSRFYTWLTRIIVNEALMKLRRRRVEKQVSLEAFLHSESETVVREIEDRRSDPENLYAESEREEILHRALEKLSPRLYAAVVSRDVEELSMAETAIKLGLTTTALKSRLVRARSKLRVHVKTIFERGYAGSADGIENHGNPLSG
jgi:RNA polymerase sigma-70 factor, ECF subfamily